MARVCRRLGALAPPELTWLQSSGDLVFDRNLFERRATMPVGERAGSGRACALWSAIRRPADPAHASEPELNPFAAVSVTPDAFRAQYVSGTMKLYPSDSLQFIIRASATHEILVPLQVCVDRAGRTAAVTLLGSSGYVGYDMDLVNALATWRYRPAVADGQPMAMCGVVQVAYKQS